MARQNDYVTKSYFDEQFDKILEKLKKLDVVTEKLDWLMGKYRNHDEEHTLLNNKVSEHSDQLEVINEKLGITI